MAYIIFTLIFVELKSIIILVYRVIGEVLEEILHVLRCRFLICFSCESRKSLLKDVDPEWIDSTQENI